jgi:hypothetical protein
MIAENAKADIFFNFILLCFLNTTVNNFTQKIVSTSVPDPDPPGYALICLARIRINITGPDPDSIELNKN